MNPAILKDIALFVLDMDGTIYLGERPFPAAIEFIRRAKASGRRIVYFTNNASKNPAVYYEKLLRLGFSAEASFREKGIFLTDGREADIVVSSFDTTLTYEKLEKACTLIRNGARFYSTHPDFNCPTETGFIPDSGAICALITASTGVQPRYFGKPHKETAEMITRRFGVPSARTAVVGDRLYTDIALGRNNGLTSILVLTGETKREDVNDANAPDFIFENIGEIAAFF